MDTILEEVASGRELVAAFEDAASPVGTGSQSSAAQMAGGDANIGDVLGSHIDKLRHARAPQAFDERVEECREASSTPFKAAGAKVIHGRSRSGNADACIAKQVSHICSFGQ